MMSTNRMSLRFGVVAAVLLLGAASASAQELLLVTAVSHTGGATLAPPDGEPAPLAVGAFLTPGTIHVPDATQLMLYDDSGIVVIVPGPTELVLSFDLLRNRMTAELRSGRVIVQAAATGTRPLALRAGLPGSDKDAVELDVVAGTTYFARAAETAALLHSGAEGAAEPKVRVGARAVDVPAGQGLVLTAGEPQFLGGSAWLAPQGFERDWGSRLGLESAHAARVPVEESLFEDIIGWDRFAGAKYVSARLQERRFNPEIRQAIQSASSPARPSKRNEVQQAVPFDAANAVPVFSPAAASVQNIRAGVTAVQLNNSAAELLRVTGSQGLGFRGLTQLAVPGTQDGLRTLGPAGLGATAR